MEKFSAIVQTLKPTKDLIKSAFQTLEAYIYKIVAFETNVGGRILCPKIKLLPFKLTK